MNYSVLAAELALPAYTGLSHQAAADLLNVADISRTRESMSGSEFFSATDPAQYGALTDSKKQQWLSFCGIDSHNPENNGVAHQFVVNMFTSGATIANLAAARTELISRATELGQPTVFAGHVEQARTL